MRIIAAMVAMLMGLAQTAVVHGKLTDRTGQPLVNAQVLYTHTKTGRTFKLKTDKKGEFSVTGVPFGEYDIEITGTDGARLLKTKRRIVDLALSGTKPDTNDLNVDLSIMPGTETASGAEPNVLPGDIRSGDRLTQQQKELIRAENIKTAQINTLIVQLHTALDARDWPTSTNVLNQLIAADPNRWEFYQNLATVQTNQSRHEEAAKSYEKGIEVAQATIGKGADQVTANREISLMMLYAGDAYARIGNNEKAQDLYMKSAAISPEPATAYFNLCRVQRGNGDTAAATASCEKAIALDPSRWEFYQTLAGMQQNAGQKMEAIKTYDKGIAAAQKAVAINHDPAKAKVGLGQMLSAEGNIYSSMQRYFEAIAVFSAAVEEDVYPASDYFNLCAAYYNLKNHEDAIAACDKAIAVDPKYSDPYFIKGAILYGQGKVVRGKFVTSPEVAEALNKYLELDPDGPRAKDAREMLGKIGSEIETTYKPARK